MTPAQETDMADPPRPADPAPRPGVEPTGGTPRWAKVVGLLVGVLALLVVVMLLPGGHGPSRHEPDDAGGHVPPAGGHR
jgi:hypothetical protein